MHKFFVIFHTIRHLRPIQIRFQLWYRARRILRKIRGFKYPISIKSTVYPLVLNEFIPKYPSFENHCFTFINQSVIFKENNIDWNYNKFGKLWEYNLNYFDFLLQPEISKTQGEQLIDDFISKLRNNTTALEPYPTALRGINWIKFFSQSSTAESGFSDTPSSNRANSLYAQYQILYDNLEYHLLGNHLLEDGFSLLFGAFYFKEEKLFNKAFEIIKSELQEQILNDGAHFELSPMYHQIILDRLLDCINLIQNNQRFKNQEVLLVLMIEKAIKMIQWLYCITFSNGQIPLLNDSAPGIAPSTKDLNQYAIRLGLLNENIICNPLNLKDSGYRRFNAPNYECIIDIGEISPSYQPGHSHADTFNFVLNVNNQPFIIDKGISTYEANKTRLEERGTQSHNTLTVSNENSSAIWSSFRLAQRAKVSIINDKPDLIIAAHDGYKKFSLTHQRTWHFNAEYIIISDTIKEKSIETKAHFWLSPQIKPTINGNKIITHHTQITFENAKDIQLIKSKIPLGYNKFEENFKIEVSFKSQLKTFISIKY